MRGRTSFCEEKKNQLCRVEKTSQKDGDGSPAAQWDPAATAHSLSLGDQIPEKSSLPSGKGADRSGLKGKEPGLKSLCSGTGNYAGNGRSIDLDPEGSWVSQESPGNGSEDQSWGDRKGGYWDQRSSSSKVA